MDEIHTTNSHKTTINSSTKAGEGDLTSSNNLNKQSNITDQTNKNPTNEPTNQNKDQNSKNSYATNSQLKAKNLRKFKLIMTALLLTSALIFALAIKFDIPWLVAMSEAALIGGLADWFAVVALFKRPLGFPFHTAIIPRNKDKIAVNIAHFIEAEFLTKQNLANLSIIQNLNTSELITKFVAPQNSSSLSLNSLLNSLQNSLLPNFITKLRENPDIFAKLNSVDFATIIATFMRSITTSPHYSYIVDDIISALNSKLLQNQEDIKTEMTKGVGAKIIAFITSYDDKLIRAASTLLTDALNHKSDTRKALENYIQILIAKLLTDTEFKAVLNSKIATALSSRSSVDISTALLKELKNSEILPNLGSNALRNYLSNFANNATKTAALNRWLKSKITITLFEHKSVISSYIQKTIISWDEKELSKKLELEVGKDLQFIRLNGMIVGALVGLGLYFIKLYLG
ncbi:MAG: DUF445 domain-containing protein [Campylobacter sp.]|nr:DUF445 domain-containing protein [Campylobacter sp.]